MSDATEAVCMVYVLDDDAAVCRTLKTLIRSVGLSVETFQSPSDFLERKLPDAPSCLVLDVRLPEMSGLDFQRMVAESKLGMPIIFITGYGDISMAVQAMKAGAVDFLTKPFRDQDLLDAIQASLEKDRERREFESQIETLRCRFESLTPREQEIFPWVVTGKLNKQIAAELGTTEANVKVHRSQLMRKMGAESFADLVRMADRMKMRSAGRPKTFVKTTSS